MSAVDNEKVWSTPSRGSFTHEGMIKSIIEYVGKQPDAKHTVIIGTDAQSFPGRQQTKYVTAVIVRRTGKGALYYVRTDMQPIAKTLRQKIWHEALLTYDLITKFKTELEEVENIEAIIPHVDVGREGDTKALVKEVTGIFLSDGWDVKIKPDSFASSTVADKHSK